MFLQTIFWLAIGVFGVQGQFILFYNGCDDYTFAKTCISNSPDLSYLTLSSIVDFIYTPTQELCSKKHQLFPVLECIYNENLKCYFKLASYPFPPNKLKVKTLDYHCSRIDTYDARCLHKSTENLFSCVVMGHWGSEINLPYSNTSRLDYRISPTKTINDEVKTYICGSQRNGKICTTYSKDFDNCPETRETFLNINKFQNPEACGGEAGYESLSGSTDTPGGQSGSTDTPGSQSGSTDTPGSQSGSTDTPGSQSGNTDTPGSQSGENTATSMYQSVIMTTIALMVFIY